MTQPISMPWSSPIFGELPHCWQGVKMAVFPVAVDGDAIERILPPGIELADGDGMVTFLSYPETDFQHPFNEAMVMLPVQVDGEVGTYIPYIYVNTDEALIPGREIAGFPKKLADVEWGRDGNSVSGSVTRWGKKILSFEGKVDGPLPDMGDDGGLPETPSFNYKLIPGPAGEIEIEEITRVLVALEPRDEEIGAARLSSETSEHDPISDLICDVDTAMIVMQSDNTIPAGTVVKQIKREARIC